MLLKCDFLFIAKCFATIMWTELSVIFLYIFYRYFSMSMFCYISHTHAYSFSWRFWQLWFPELNLHHLFTFFCLIVAHQQLTWDHYLLPWPFQNSFSYCGLQILMSVYHLEWFTLFQRNKKVEAQPRPFYFSEKE